MNKRPLILIVNDDGVTAPGIKSLYKIMKRLGEVVVVAPDSPQSGMGHATTINSTIHIDKINKKKNIYSCSGTPSDCVKIAITQVLKRKPDLCVCGINHGSNAAINVIYSGTMSAAIEAGIKGINAIGFSLLNHNWNADFSASEKYVEKITAYALSRPKDNILLNVNIPDLPSKQIKGMKICHQAKSCWKERFEKHINPQGKEYYWLDGILESNDLTEETDLFALQNGYVSIVPINFDLTDYSNITTLKNNLNV